MSKRKKSLVGWVDKCDIEDFRFRRTLCDGGTYYPEKTTLQLLQFPKQWIDQGYDLEDIIKVRITIKELLATQSANI